MTLLRSIFAKIKGVTDPTSNHWNRSLAGRLGTILLALMVAFIEPARAIEDYKLQAGDVLEFSVAGIPEMRQKLPINGDGRTSFPLIGEIAVAGRSLAAVRQEVQSLLPKRSLSMRANDGRESVTVISGEEITLVIAENRPLYIQGDVAKPGELPYRPGLSVRQAVALAGGYDLVRFRTENPILASADLKAEYEGLWTDFARTQLAILRLRAEYDNRKEIDRAEVTRVPLPAPVIDALYRNEKDQFDARNLDFSREREHIQRQVKMMDDRIGVLSDQRAKEAEGAEIDSSEIERIGDLQKRGLVPVTRQIETRRLSLLSATRVLQVATLLEDVKRNRADVSRSVQRLEDQRRLSLSKDLQDNTVKLTQVRQRIAAVGEKLLYTGVVKSQLVRETGGRPQIAVYRGRGAAGSRKIDADEDTPLEPGDSIDVTLKVTYGAEDAVR